MLSQTLSLVNNLNNLVDSITGRPIKAAPVSFKVSSRQTSYKLKKNTSAYMFFSAEVRADYKQRGIQLGPNEMMKVISNLWKGLAKADKAKYETLAKQDKERYRQEKDELMRTNPSLITKNKTKNNHIKKAWSAYDFFMREMYPQVKAANPSLYSADILKIVSGLWKGVDETQRATYEEMSKIDKQEKQEQLKALELKRRFEDSQSSSTDVDEEFSVFGRKQIKLDNSYQGVTVPITPSLSLFEDQSEATLDNGSNYTPELSPVSGYSSCSITPLSNGQQMKTVEFDSQTDETTFQTSSILQSICDIPAVVRAPSFNFSVPLPAYLEEFNFDFLNEALKQPLTSVEAKEGETVAVPNAELSGDSFENILNLNLLREPSFNLRQLSFTLRQPSFSLRQPSFNFGFTNENQEDFVGIFSQF